ncbi:hypothetical protein BC826DRAFT_610352 [Russula brevipes]|nr:hypothetical protein BC826DRAFT_610352 [Russula brevipes]
MAHYDIFREQLAVKYPAYGHALWEPNPGRLYSPVEVGDVGYVREGKFHRLFNALLPADHPSHRNFGVPEYHEPLTPNPSEHIDVGTLKPNHYCSHGVTVVDAEPDVRAFKPEDLPQVSYICNKRQCGAALFLPVQAQRQDTVARGDFGRWIIKHIDRWFAFTRRLGLGIGQMEDIILVTGCHRTRSWANVAFLESQQDSQVSFEVDVAGVDGPDTNINWKFSPERIRGAVLNWGPDGKNLPEDQCVFIRGFRVTRTLKIFPKHLIAAGGSSSDPDEDNSEPDLELMSIPKMTEDPLHLLLGHVAEGASDCDMILVHDDDLTRVNEICESNVNRHLY